MSLYKLIDNIVDSILLQESNDYDNILDDNSVIATANMVNVGRNRAAIIAASKIAQYSAILDKRTCPLCKELDSLYAEVGSPDHLEFTPPIHHRCRCIWVYIGNEDTPPTVNFKRPDKPLIDKHGGLVGKSSSIFKLLGDSNKVSKSQLDNMANDFFKTLLKEEQKMLRDYTGPISYPINDYLRFKKISENNLGNFSRQEVMDAKNKMAKIFKKANTLDRQVEVYRFANSDMFKRDINTMIGKSFKDKGYMSTTTKENFEQKLAAGADVFFKIKIPEGTKAIPIDHKSDYGDQQELLLDKGQKIKINNVTFNAAPEAKTLKNVRQSTREKWDMYIIECEVVKDEKKSK